MHTHRWMRAVSLASLGGAFLALTGCQAQMAGMTLPSARYLEHRPQYFQRDPDFPLQRELATQEAQAGLAAGPAGGGVQAPREAPGIPGGAGAPGAINPNAAPPAPIQ
jgi:hypothetical protein